jgi:hypothetical protein
MAGLGKGSDWRTVFCDTVPTERDRQDQRTAARNDAYTLSNSDVWCMGKMNGWASWKDRRESIEVQPRIVGGGKGVEIRWTNAVLVPRFVLQVMETRKKGQDHYVNPKESER